MVAAPVDSVAATVYAAVWTPGGEHPLKTDDARALLVGIGKSFHLPSPLPLSVVDGGRPRAAAVISGVIALTMHGSHVADVQLTVSSGSDAIDSALAAAPALAERAGGLPTFREKETTVLVAITTFDATNPAERGVTAVEPIARVVLPVWDTNQPAALAPWNPEIVYPPSPPRYTADQHRVRPLDRMRDTVVMQYVVDAQGEVDLSTAQARSARYGATLDSVQRVIPELRYSPARVGGCPVAQLVRQPFAFVGQGPDTAQLDAAPPVAIPLQARRDTLTDMPAMLVTLSRCWYVRRADTAFVRARMRDISAESDSLRIGVRLAGHPGPPADGVLACQPQFHHPQQIPMESGVPGYESLSPHTARVTVDFLIDSTGRVDRSTIHIVGESDPTIGNAIASWLPRARFDPATLDGRPVAQFVRQSIDELRVWP